MFNPTHQAAARAYAHIEHLSVTIGTRPSTGEGERAAAAYVAAVLRQAGLRNVRLEPFRSPRSTYAPYRAAFVAALLGTAAQRLVGGRVGAAAGAALSALAAQGFFAEADLANNWTHLFAQHGDSQNIVGVVRARGETRRRVVLYGHVDSHRTPVFYSNTTWLAWFSRLIGAGFVSLVVNAAVYGALAAKQPKPQRGWPLLASQTLTGALQLLGLALTTQAEFSPYSPGANDNASGAATALALGERLAHAPLEHTEVWIVATGCEEVGSHGMEALLAQHADALRDALFIGFDMVGIGEPAVIPVQGLLRKRHADPELLAAARRVAAQRPDLGAWEHSIDAFDDSYMVARHGFRGITIDSEGAPGSDTSADHKHWHRMTDTIDRISETSLERVQDFAWELLLHVDGN